MEKYFKVGHLLNQKEYLREGIFDTTYPEKSLYMYYKELYESEAVGVWWQIIAKKPYQLPYERLSEISLIKEQDKLSMDIWCKYLKAGWNSEHIVKTEENTEMLINLPTITPIEGYLMDKDYIPLGNLRGYEHSDFPLKWTKEILVEFNEVKGKQLNENIYNNWRGILLEKEKGIIIPTIEQKNNEEIGYNLIREITDKKINTIVSIPVEGKDPVESLDTVIRGVVPGNFVESHINKEGKLDYLISYTKIQTPGDITEKSRYLVNSEINIDKDNVWNAVDINAQRNSYMQIGQDKLIEDKENLVGVFGCENIVIDFTTVDIGNFIIEKLFAVVTIYVILVGLQGYWYILYRTINKELNPNFEWTKAMNFKNWNLIEIRDNESILIDKYEQEKIKSMVLEEARHYCEYNSWVFWTCLEKSYEINIIKNIYEGLDIFLNIGITI